VMEIYVNPLAYLWVRNITWCDEYILKQVMWWICRNEIRNRNRGMVDSNYMPMLYAGTIQLGWFCAGGFGTYACGGNIPISADKIPSEKCKASMELCSHVLFLCLVVWFIYRLFCFT
jgi:hypothetical protein